MLGITDWGRFFKVESTNKAFSCHLLFIPVRFAREEEEGKTDNLSLLQKGQDVFDFQAVFIARSWFNLTAGSC